MADEYLDIDPEKLISDINKKSNIKTNILILAKNFINLRQYLIYLKTFINELVVNLNIENLINEVIDRLQQTKTVLPIVYNMGVGQTIIEGDYSIFRANVNDIEITKDSNWNVTNLVVSIKDQSGIMVYPVIQTANNKISIHFEDGIVKNYNAFIL